MWYWPVLVTPENFPGDMFSNGTPDKRSVKHVLGVLEWFYMLSEKTAVPKKPLGMAKDHTFPPFWWNPSLKASLKAKEVKRSDGLWRLACGDVFSWGLLTWQNCTFWFKLQNIAKHTKNGREKVYGMYWAFEMVSDLRFGHCKCHFPNRQNCEIARFSRFWLWSSLWCFLNHLAAAAPVYLLA